MTFPIALLGGNSFVAPYALRRLAALGYGGVCCTRREPEPGNLLPDGFAWRRSASAEDVSLLPAGSVVLALLPVDRLAPMLDFLPRPAQIVAISSTSVLTKSDSPDASERRRIRALIEAEAALAAYGQRTGVPWTLLRPTLIYDGRRDQNVTAIARFIRRFGFFPILSPAKGLRQPIHADDVAAASLAAIGNPQARGRAYTISGGETLSYRAMVERIFAALGREARILPVPPRLLRPLVAAARGIGWKQYTYAMFERMNQDLAFDDEPARTDLHLSARPFRPELAGR